MSQSFVGYTISNLTQKQKSHGVRQGDLDTHCRGMCGWSFDFWNVCPGSCTQHGSNGL